jgi:hypothetical protein
MLCTLVRDGQPHTVVSCYFDPVVRAKYPSLVVVADEYWMLRVVVQGSEEMTHTVATGWYP